MDIASALDGAAININPTPTRRRSGYCFSMGIYLSAGGAFAPVDIPAESAADPDALDHGLKMAVLALSGEWRRVIRPAGYDAVGPETWRIHEMGISPGRYYLRVCREIIPGRETSLTAYVYDGEGRHIASAGGINPGPPDTQPDSAVSLRFAGNEEQLNFLRRHCRGLVILALDAVAPYAVKALSPEETKPLDRMGERRRRSYIGARLACKFLSRRLAGGDLITPADAITTITPGTSRPRCPLPSGGDVVHCSISHDDAYALAAAGDVPVGADIEPVTERAARLLPRFASEGEQELAKNFGAGKDEGAVRIWSIKEAAAKVLDIPLPGAWRCVEAAALGPSESIVMVDGRMCVAYHGMIDGHLITILPIG